MKKSWNGLQDIGSQFFDFREQIKDPVMNLRQAFEIALNQTIIDLFEKRYVQSINRALMAIVMDEYIQNNCVRFPKSPKGLKAYLNEDTRRFLRHYICTGGANHIAEQSSIFKQLHLLSDVDMFKITGLDDIRPYSVWTFGKDVIMGEPHPGKTPTGLVYNTLYFFTNPGDLVVDPMAGGGVVGECCYETKRRCKMYDIKPTRDDIKQHDMSDGIPTGMHKADLMFWDPPYYKMKHIQYGTESISSLPRNQYLKFFSDFALNSYEAGIKKVALLIAESTNSHLTYSEDNGNGNGEDPIFLCDYIQTFRKSKWKQVNRISCNIHPSAISSPEINDYRKNKLIYGLARDLIIFQRH